MRGSIATTTHLVWIGRWAECRKGYSPRLAAEDGDGVTYEFKTTRDLIDWLRWPAPSKEGDAG